VAGSLPVFEAHDVQARLPMERCIELMHKVQVSLSRGKIELPLRTFMPLPFRPGGGNGLLLMPGALSEPPVFGAKLLSIFPENGRRPEPLPVIQGHVLLFDGSSGEPLALIDAASLTAIRTAAASGAATRALAREDAGTLALLGYGVQADTHLAAMRAVRPIHHVRVWGPSPDRADAFARRHEAPGLTIEPVTSPEAAVRGAEVICAVSASRTPIIRGDWLAPGTHLNLVGAHSPDSREADAGTLARARVFTEIGEFALAEAGDLLLAIEEGVITAEDIAGEIGQVFAGDLEGRQSLEQITLYKSLGNTAQDLIAAHQVYHG
jgi:alanine dehydrogenase